VPVVAEGADQALASELGLRARRVGELVVVVGEERSALVELDADRVGRLVIGLLEQNLESLAVLG
jgi:hypothetical protein